MWYIVAAIAAAFVFFKNTGPVALENPVGNNMSKDHPSDGHVLDLNTTGRFVFSVDYRYAGGQDVFVANFYGNDSSAVDDWLIQHPNVIILSVNKIDR